MIEDRKIQVVLLPSANNPKFWVYPEVKEIALNNGNINFYGEAIGHHLYFFSNDEIKEGEYGIFLPTMKIIKGNEEDGIHPDIKKIIITTDNSLKIVCSGCRFSKLNYIKYNCDCESQPQPSRIFTHRYIEAYNKGQIITEVLVEYEDTFTKNEEVYIDENNCKGNYSTHSKQLKVNSEDNTVDIKKVKDSWNREEHIEGMWEAYKVSNTIIEEEKYLRQEFDKWIERKLWKTYLSGGQ